MRQLRSASGIGFRARAAGTRAGTVAAVVLAAGMTLPGCGGPRKPRPIAERPSPVNTSLDAIARDGEPDASVTTPALDPASVDQDALAQASLDLQALLDARAETEAGTGPDAGTDTNATGDPAGIPAATPSAPADPSALADATDDAGAEAESAPAAAGTGSLDARIEHAARELSALLVARSAEANTPTGDLTRAALADIAGGGGLWTDEAAMRSELAQRGLVAHEPGLVIESRRLVEALIKAPSVADALDALDASGERLRRVSPSFRVREAALCRTVRGLASYEEFESSTFLVGKPVRVIVYTELERFGHRELLASGSEAASIGDRFAADVSQELTLYHEPGGELQVWHQPRARVIETSRRPRREMYLVNEVVLPARLTVGSYTLKVVTRDETTGMTDERSIPIRLVADARLTQAGDD